MKKPLLASSRRKLNSDFELAISDHGSDRGRYRSRGDIHKVTAQIVVVTLFGEGETAAAAEDDVWVQAQEWVRKRGRAR